MSKTMPDFSNNDEEDFDDDHNFESTNLQLNSADKDDEEEFGLDDVDDEDEEDDQLKKLKAAAREIDAEAGRLRELQAALRKANGAASSSAAPGGDGDSDQDDDMADSGLNSIPGLGAPAEDTANAASKESQSPAVGGEEGGEEQTWDPDEADARSIFAKNVDYSSEANEINTFFSSCGAIERLTILTDKMTGRPKGCAYIQFKSKEAVESALALDGAMFKGRPLSISKKHRTLPPHKLRRRRRRRRRFNPYYSYGYVPYYPRRRRRSWAPY